MILCREAVDVVRLAVSEALADEIGEPNRFGRVPWHQAPEPDLVQAIRVHRVAPTLAPVLDVLDPPRSVADHVRGMVRGNALGAMRLAAESHRALEALDAAGVPALVYKGIALSVQSTGDLAARGAGDVDVLVDPLHVPAAHEALLGAGWTGEPVPDAPRWWAYYLSSCRERSYVSTTSSIDLHWRIGWHETPLPHARTLLARSSSVDVAGNEMRTLSLSDAFAIACYTAMLDRYSRLRHLVDIVRLARSETVHLTEDMHWRLRRVVAESVSLAAGLLGGIPAVRVAEFGRPDRVDRRRLNSIWQYSSIRPLWFEGGLTTGEIAAVYRDSARFAGLTEAARMTVIDGLLPPKHLPPDAGPVGTATAVATRAAHFVRRWVVSSAKRSDQMRVT